MPMAESLKAALLFVKPSSPDLSATSKFPYSPALAVRPYSVTQSRCLCCESRRAKNSARSRHRFDAASQSATDHFAVYRPSKLAETAGLTSCPTPIASSSSFRATALARNLALQIPAEKRLYLVASNGDRPHLYGNITLRGMATPDTEMAATSSSKDCWSRVG
jgi:hypothetical protein